MVMGRHRKRDFTQGSISGELDTGKGSVKGNLPQDDVDALAERTQPIGKWVKAVPWMTKTASNDKSTKDKKKKG